MKSIQSKKLAIIGAGPGGLTLARLLQMRGADVTVFERDSSRDSRNQGATLDLHHDSGLAALEAAGLMDAFRASYRPGADSLLITDDQARVLYSDPSSGGAMGERPEIDRGPLRTLLIDSLHPGTILWNRKLESVSESKGQVQLGFASGESFVADVAIAADGVNSRLRPSVTSIRPVYSGVMIVEGNIADAAADLPAFLKLLSGGFRAILAVGGEKSLAMGTKGDGSAAFYCGFKAPESWAKSPDMDFSDADVRLKWFHTTYPGWSDFYDPLFQHTSKLVPRPQYFCPFDQRWEAKSNMTLIGDAAHVMPPYAGEGVNMAMLDALVLARQLLREDWNAAQSAIAAYEREMFARTSEVAKITMRNTEMFHSPSAGEQLVDLFRGFAAERAALSATQQA